jgi:hypothetical protein
VKYKGQLLQIALKRSQLTSRTRECALTKLSEFIVEVFLRQGRGQAVSRLTDSLIIKRLLLIVAM